MPFAITVSNLIDVLKNPGCPICHLERKAARKYVEVFLWENLMDHSLRDEALAAYGYCPPHTRLMASVEQTSSGPPLGVNILYEVLNSRVSQELKNWPLQQMGTSGLRRILKKLKLDQSDLAGTPVLRTKNRCPVCVSAEQAGLNSLQTLFEELNRGTADITAGYQASDGLCLRHLRQGLERLADDHSKAASLVQKKAIMDLDQQAQNMNEFIRKANWEYRDEKLTPEEARAWRQALTFYTGYPDDAFSFSIDEFI